MMFRYLNKQYSILSIGALLLVFTFFQNCSGQFKTSGEVHAVLDSQTASNNETPPAPSPGPIPPAVEAPKVSISMGPDYGCYLNLQGLVSCAGIASGYNFGQDQLQNRQVSLIRVPGVSDVKSLSTDRPSCALHKNGTVTCWSVTAPPAQVSGLTGVKAVKGGLNFNCGISSDDKVLCWGTNLYGGLGNPAAGANSATPVEVVGITGVKTLFGSPTSVCALTSNDKVFCWGNNFKNLLTYPQVTASTIVGTPFESPSMSGIGLKMITLGSNFMCALTGQKTVRCWGSNGQGQLGNGQISVDVNAVYGASDVVGINNAVYIEASSHAACALLEDGKIKCWGESGYGVLGSRVQNSPVPLEVMGLPNNIVSLNAGSDVMCATTQDNKVYCWGDHVNGLTGLGTIRGIEYTPTLSFIAGDI